MGNNFVHTYRLESSKEYCCFIRKHDVLEINKVMRLKA